MVHLMAMEPYEITPVHCQHDSVSLSGKGQDLLIRYLLIRVTGFQHCEHIMTKFTQCVDNFAWKMLISVKKSHKSSFFVFAQCPFNLFRMGRGICPRLHQINRTEDWKVF